MVKAVITYSRQRFPLQLFGPLALFLFFFAKGGFLGPLTDIFWLPMLLVWLFLFRLFDDLQNREFDQSKPNRSYTYPKNSRQLQAFLTGFSLLVLAGLLFLNFTAGLVFTGFFLLNLLLYRLLLNRWKFRHLLPLLKYPFFSLLLLYVFQPVQFPERSQLYSSLALFPAFILYETLTDEAFQVNNFTKFLLFSAVFLPFFPAISPTLPGLIFTGLANVFLLALFFLRGRALPYLLLLLLFFTRLTFPL